MTKDDKLSYFDLVKIIEQEIVKIEQDGSLVEPFIPAVISELTAFQNRTSRAYTHILKDIALSEAESAREELSELMSSIIDKRFSVLKYATEVALKNIEKKINSPLWLGERNAYIEIIERVKKEISRLPQDPKPVEYFESVLDEIRNLVSRISTDERRTQIRLPIQIFLWGLPIVIGSLVSGKLTPFQNMIVFVSLLFLSVASFILIKFRFSNKLRAFKGITLLIKNRKMVSIISLQLIVAAIVFLAAGIIPLDSYIVESRMNFDFETLPISVEGEKAYSLRYRLNYNHPSPALGVSVMLQSPGILKNNQLHEYNILTKTKPIEGSFHIKIPKEISEGQYPLNLTIYFNAQRAFQWPKTHKKREAYSIHKEIVFLVK